MNLTAQVRNLRAQWEQGELSLPECLAHSAQALALAMACSRAAVWVFEDTSRGRRLRCLAMYDATKARAVRAPDQTGEAVVEYFRAIKQAGAVQAPDVYTHPATSRLFTMQSDWGVRSLIGAPLSINGETYGTVVCTSLFAPQLWSVAQGNELRLASAQLSLVIANALRDATLTQPAPLTTVTPSTVAAYGEHLGTFSVAVQR